MAEPQNHPMDEPANGTDKPEHQAQPHSGNGVATQELEAKPDSPLLRKPDRRRRRTVSAPNSHPDSGKPVSNEADDEVANESASDVNFLDLASKLAFHAAVEAILLCSERPVSAARIAQVLADTSERAVAGFADSFAPAALWKSAITPKLVRSAIEALNKTYRSTNRSFRIEPLAGGYRLMTLADFGPVLAALHGARQKASLSRAAVETLAIIAYKQPVTRARLEAIRGVACGEVLRSLTERRLVAVAGRAEELGRPMLYATTRQFLEVFGLSSAKDLPSPEEFAKRMSEGFGDGDPDEVLDASAETRTFPAAGASESSSEVRET